MSSPKAKVTRSNRVGCASEINDLEANSRRSATALSAECPHNGFRTRSPEWPPCDAIDRVLWALFPRPLSAKSKMLLIWAAEHAQRDWCFSFRADQAAAYCGLTVYKATAALADLVRCGLVRWRGDRWQLVTSL